ncbi:hypothetical protein BG004_001418 [Podila humilis]|nr:hypothetical protein BG004_001418 [Podila humilis]
MAVLNYNSSGKQLPSLQQPGSTSLRACSSISYKRTAFILVAITSALLLINTVNIQLPNSPSSAVRYPSPSPPPPHPVPEYNIDNNISNGPLPPKTEQENIQPTPDDDDARWQFTEETNDEDSEEEDEGEDDEFFQDQELPQAPNSSFRNSPNNREAPTDVVAEGCPKWFLSTSSSFDIPSFSSSSTVPPALSTPALLPDEVSCRAVPSLLDNFSLAYCVSNQDCSRGFIQIVHTVPKDDYLWKIKPSKSQLHAQYFQETAGPDDFYFVLQGAQKLAVGAHLVSKEHLVNVAGVAAEVRAQEDDINTTLVYRADFRMTLPGTVQLSGWLTYDKYRSIREDKPNIWPQWRHEALIKVDTEVDAMDEIPVSGPSTRFTICPACELEPFLEQVKAYREDNFEKCDRMAPVRGSYWREDIAVQVYSDLDVMNKGVGAGGVALWAAANARKGKKNAPATSDGQEQKLTKGWRFVPSGCTMTPTTRYPMASSEDPFNPSCDSIASPASELRTPAVSAQQTPASEGENENEDGESEDADVNMTKRGENDDADAPAIPRRHLLFTGDSQVRATYNAILNHYRPADPNRQRFNVHDEFLPNEHKLAINSTLVGKAAKGGHADDTQIEIMYKADQFLDGLIASPDNELDKFDTIYINLGQWPASGPTAGGQWSTAQFLDRWEKVIARLNRWKESRKARAAAEQSEGGVIDTVLKGSGASSRVIWAGQNAFPMRTDNAIRLKGDWRTNARLGYWDDWIENISQKEGSWFRRMNSWQLTFPMLDEVVDRAHFQDTDAIDALKLEALYKLDLCSRMSADLPYSS